MKRITFLRILITLLLFFLAMPCLSSRAEEEAPYLGDLNGDRAMTAADAAVMLRGIAFGRLGCETHPELDFTRNGEIDGIDARAVLLYTCGGILDWVAFGERVSSGLCDERLFDRFSYSGTLDDGKGNYKSENVSVSIYSGREGSSDYHLADIYVQDIACLVNTFGRGEYFTGPDYVRRMFDATAGAIVAINGDYYSVHQYGPVIRNGVTYIDRITRNWDIAVLLSDGVLLTYAYQTLTKEELLGMDVYQTWVFGPSLLNEHGLAKTTFRTGVMPKNPRSVLGYYEPGHYAFLAVDGRTRQSRGMTIEELSQLCELLGFSCAYNLDGGQSSVLITNAGPVNNPYNDGRPISDIIAVREIPQG